MKRNKNMIKDPNAYYQIRNFKDVRKQFSSAGFLVVMFIVTILYASGLQNHTLKIILLSMAFVYPVVLIFGLWVEFSKTIRPLTFTVESRGIRISYFKVFTRLIRWSDVQTIELAAVGMVPAVGLMYKPGVKRIISMSKVRQRLFGWDELLSNAHNASGASLLDGCQKAFRKYSRFVDS
jgi:hypothetical protein